jgi:hypothetical protein
MFKPTEWEPKVNTIQYWDKCFVKNLQRKRNKIWIKVAVNEVVTKMKKEVQAPAPAPVIKPVPVLTLE